MRYAIVSDIHANHQAWKAVWLDIRSMAVDKVICLGDNVGYGPNPQEVLESLYTTVDYFVLGNHDAALCGMLDTSLFTDCARDMIQWTAGRVGPPAIRFLSNIPLTLAGPGFRCAHGEFGDPACFRYVLEPEEALPGWGAVDDPLLFVGHTHRPCIAVVGQSGTPRMIAPEDFTLEPGKRFLVNVGSVGQPRDWDSRASYCIYDTESKSVFWRRIPFDLDAYRDALRAADIPLATSPFLDDDPRPGRPPLREMIPFNPPANADKAVQNVTPVQYLDTLRRRVRWWKRLVIGLVAFLIMMAGFGGWIWMRQIHPESDVPGSDLVAVRAVDMEPGVNLLSFPPLPMASGTAIPKWSVHLGNRYRQQALWAALENERPGFILRSEDSQREIWISSASIHVSPGMRLTLQALVKKSPDFSGSLAVVIPLVLRVESPSPETDASGAPILETRPQFVVKEPTVPRADGWSLVKQKFELPVRPHSVKVQVRGRFTGIVWIRDLRLERK